MPELNCYSQSFLDLSSFLCLPPHFVVGQSPVTFWKRYKRVLHFFPCYIFIVPYSYLDVIFLFSFSENIWRFSLFFILHHYFYLPLLSPICLGNFLIEISLNIWCSLTVHSFFFLSMLLIHNLYTIKCIDFKNSISEPLFTFVATTPVKYIKHFHTSA